MRRGGARVVPEYAMLVNQRIFRLNRATACAYSNVRSPDIREISARSQPKEK